MGRPREFDVDVAADRARAAFWASGFAATSVDDLREATGVSVGSLYKAFGDKAGLHRAGLRRYLADARAGAAAVLADADAVAGLRAWLARAVDGACTPGPQGGCYAVLATAELAGGTPDVADVVREHDVAVLRLLADALGRAPLREGTTPDVAARLLLAVVKGLQVTARAGVDRARAEETASAALDAVLAS